MHTAIRTTLHDYPWRQLAVSLAPLVCTLAALAVFLGTDNQIISFFESFRDANRQLTKPIQFISNNLTYVLYAVYVVLFCCSLIYKNYALSRLVLYFVLIHICVSLLLVHSIKVAIGSPRPGVGLLGATYSPFSLDNAYHSFPSGHTTEIVSAALPLAVWRRQTSLSLLLGCMIACIGATRIYLSMHYFSDVIAGMFTGVLTSLLFFHFCRRELI